MIRKIAAAQRALAQEEQEAEEAANAKEQSKKNAVNRFQVKKPTPIKPQSSSASSKPNTKFSADVIKNDSTGNGKSSRLLRQQTGAILQDREQRSSGSASRDISFLRNVRDGKKLNG